MRLDCSRNPPVSPSASHPPLARGAMELAGVQRGAAYGYGKKLAFPRRPAPTTRGSGCSENGAQPSGSPHATVANDVKSPCRFSGRVKGAVCCASGE